MLRIDDKDETPLQARRRRPFMPMHERLRLYICDINGKLDPIWQWRGSMFAHNKRRKPKPR
jgi:hypothetical protein